jgi:hypothetical protein
MSGQLIRESPMNETEVKTVTLGPSPGAGLHGGRSRSERRTIV